MHGSKSLNFIVPSMWAAELVASAKSNVMKLIFWLSSIAFKPSRGFCCLHQRNSEGSFDFSSLHSVGKCNYARSS